MNRSGSPSYEDGYQEGAGDAPIADQLDLQHYLRIMRKHKWPIVLFTAAITCLAAYYALTATPVFRATSTLLIEQQKANVVSIESLYGVDTENTDYYETQFQLLRSRALAQRVVTRMNLWENPELAGSDPLVPVDGAPDSAVPDAGNEAEGGVEGLLSSVLSAIGLAAPQAATGDQTVESAPLDSPVVEVVDADSTSALSKSALDGEMAQEGLMLAPSEERVVAKFMARLSVSPVRKTKLVNISYESSDPILAARVANIVGEEYIQSYMDAKLELTTTASAWLTERLGELKADLDEAEGRLIAFQRENDLVDVEGSVGRLNEQQLLLDTAELTQARSELASARDVYNEVQALQGSPELLESIPAVQADPLVQRTQIEQGIVKRELDELLNRYGDRHPSVLDARSELASLNGSLEGHIRRVSGTLARDFQLAQQRVASINAELASGRTEIQLIGNKKFELDGLQREVETKQDVYDQYFSRMTEANSADGLEAANARISDFARVPIAPVRPKKQMIIGIAALASLVLSMLMAFLYETMDDTIKSTNDIEVKLGLRLLGMLPLVKGGMMKRAQSLPLNPEQIPDKKGTFSEAVNTVRTALTLDDDHSPRKVIVVTSSVPGEGKSTASINIAYSLGQLERVLLVDCDMRRPTIAKAAGLDKNVNGLSNLLAQTARAQSCIKRGVFGGKVDILPSGPIPDQPLELLASKRFERVIAELGRYYDRIVIDSAPTQAVSDALVLSRLADGVVYVVKSHDTSIDLVRRGIQRLRQADALIAGVLITQVDIDKITSYGGDYYYQGYYDYYGYTDKGERLKRPGKIRLSQEELMAIQNDDREVDLGLDGFETVANRDRSFDTDVSRVDHQSARFVGSEGAKNGAARHASVGSARAPEWKGDGRNQQTNRRHARLGDDLDIL
jgi:capsular exopolysaccharide synthesis family protein